MRLREIQDDFGRLMLSGAKGLETIPSDFATVFVQDDIALDARLKVYRSNVIGTITRALVATFPLIKILAGEDFLRDAARAYVLAHPPSGGCLQLYGEQFADFLGALDVARHLPYLADVARMEYAMNCSYYAPDDTPFNADMLARVEAQDLPDLKLVLRSSAHLLASDFPLDRLRAYCLDPAQQDVPRLDAGGVRLMVFRPRLEVMIVKLDQDAFFMLEQLSDRATFGEATESTLCAFPDFDLPAFLQKHLSLQSFSTVDAR